MLRRTGTVILIPNRDSIARLNCLFIFIPDYRRGVKARGISDDMSYPEAKYMRLFSSTRGKAINLAS